MCLRSRFVSRYTLYLFCIFVNGVVTEDFYCLYRLPDHLNFSERSTNIQYIGSEKVSKCLCMYTEYFITKVGGKLGISDLFRVTRNKSIGVELQL